MVGGYLQFIILVILPLFTVSENCNQLTDCSCQKENGDIIDLYPFKPKSFVVDNLTDRYEWCPCREIQCMNIYQTICKTQPVARKTNIGSLNTTQFVTSDEQVSLVFQNPSGTQKSYINLSCAKNANGSLKFAGIYVKNNLTTYHFQFLSSHFCFNHSISTISTISTGTVLCIVFLCVVLVYFILGSVINKCVRQFTGPEIIPNLDFWKGCGGYIKDGFIFTASKCGKLNKRNDYDNL